MADADPIDAMAPWTIKSVSTATRAKVNVAAKREGLTVGQWLERRVAEWEADGGPVPVRSVAPTAPGIAPMSLSGLRDAMGAAAAVAAASGVAVPKVVARHAFAVLAAQLRDARGLPPVRPRQTQLANGRATPLLAIRTDATEPAE